MQQQSVLQYMIWNKHESIHTVKCKIINVGVKRKKEKKNPKQLHVSNVNLNSLKQDDIVLYVICHI